MNTKKITVTREAFADAISTAEIISTKLFPKSKLGWYCEQFLKLNKTTIKKHNKELEKHTKTLNAELKKTMIDNAIEKDGMLVFNEKGGYRFSKVGEQAVMDKKAEVEEKINEVVDEFLATNVEVIVTTNELTALPEKLEQTHFNMLNNFVFKNENENAEEIKSED